MKKENRKAAQQRRAQERKKMERQKKIRKIVSWAAGIVVVVLLFLLVGFGDNLFSDSSSAVSSSSAGTDSGSSSDNSVSDSSSADSSSASGDTAYSTDTSLTVEDGDTVNIDYVGSVDGVEFEGGSTDGAGADLTIGSGRYIDDFEEQLIGSHPGDTVNVNVTFPDDYQSTDLQGKDALFVVTINGIYDK